ncbi:MAG: FMN-binding protein [Ruminococcaceae bacterium]|nr:FMN-binding protein [Oscillospiraceae bacterium]
MKKYPTFLPVVTLFATAALLLAATLTLQGVTSRRAQAQHQTMLQTLLPGSTAFTRQAYTGTDANVRSVHRGETGWVVETAVRGYADTIVVAIGISNAGTVTGLVVRQAHETAGLGSRILRDETFLSQFLGLRGEAEIGRNIDAITGATVSSRAVARCVNSAIAAVTGADIVTEATVWGGNR